MMKEFLEQIKYVYTPDTADEIFEQLWDVRDIYRLRMPKCFLCDQNASYVHRGYSLCREHFKIIMRQPEWLPRRSMPEGKRLRCERR